MDTCWVPYPLISQDRDLCCCLLMTYMPRFPEWGNSELTVCLGVILSGGDAVEPITDD